VLFAGVVVFFVAHDHLAAGEAFVEAKVGEGGLGGRGRGGGGWLGLGLGRLGLWLGTGRG